MHQKITGVFEIDGGGDNNSRGGQNNKLLRSHVCDNNKTSASTRLGDFVSSLSQDPEKVNRWLLSSAGDAEAPQSGKKIIF